MSSEVAIRVEHLSKCYQIYGRPRDRLFQMFARGRKRYYQEFWALKDISFEIKQGETVGVIGRNGSGKSTLLQLVCGTLSPSTGKIETSGRVAALLELGAGFNPEFTGRENVYMNSAVLGLTREETDQRFSQIENFADIGNFIDQPVKTYSSGMFVRLAFAVQAHIDASIIVIDEALAVGDVFFRQKCYSRLEQLRRSGVAILLVSHSMPDIEQYCERAILLDHGLPLFIGSASEATKRYYLLHQTDYDTVVPQTSLQESLLEVEKQGQNENGNVIAAPPHEAFIDLSNKHEVSNGQGRCTGIAICNTAGDPCNVFLQGDTAVFYYEFELLEDVGVPICGVVIINERGIIVHGKNSWQLGNEVPSGLKAGDKVICQQKICLQLGVGEYSFEVGLASISVDDWNNRLKISHDEFNGKHRRICHIPGAGQFSIGLASNGNVGVLRFHGIADLPGDISLRSSRLMIK